MEARIIFKDEYLQLQQSPIYWSENKFREMESALTGHWSKDVWEGKDNPYKNKERTSLLNFGGLSHVLKTEIKYAFYPKMTNYEQSWSTVHVTNVLKSLIDALKADVFTILARAIIARPASYLELKLTEYFCGQEKLYSTTAHSCNKYGQPQLSKSKDQIHIFNHIYSFLIDFYEPGDEYDKDVWDIKKLKPNNNRKERYLNFTELKDSWLFKPSRHQIKYQLAIHSGNTVYNKLRCIRVFGNFLFERYPQVDAENLNREIVVDYISFIKNSSDTSYIYQHHCLSYLQEFLELCQRERWADIPNQQIIYFDDFPKSKRKVNPNYLPDEVVRKVYQHIDKVLYPMYGQVKH